MSSRYNGGAHEFQRLIISLLPSPKCWRIIQQIIKQKNKKFIQHFQLPMIFKIKNNNFLTMCQKRAINKKSLTYKNELSIGNIKYILVEQLDFLLNRRRKVNYQLYKYFQIFEACERQNWKGKLFFELFAILWIKWKRECWEMK